MGSASCLDVSVESESFSRVYEFGVLFDCLNGI